MKQEYRNSVFCGFQTCQSPSYTPVLFCEMVFIYEPPCCWHRAVQLPWYLVILHGRSSRMLVCSNCSFSCFMLVLLGHSFLMILIVLLSFWNQKTRASSYRDPHPISAMQQQASQSHSLSTWTLFVDTVVYSNEVC